MESKYVERKKYYDTALRRSTWGGVKLLYDMLMCRLILRCTFKEYVWYELWRFNWNTRNSFAFECHTVDMVKKYNSNSQGYKNKTEIYSLISAYLGRSYIFTKNMSFDVFRRFCVGKNSIVYKPTFGSGGRGVTQFKIRENLPDIYDELSRLPCGIIEECILQHDAMKKLNPFSVNTIRIVTLSINGQCKVLYAAQRMGVSGSFTDNACSGGIYAAIDIDKGVICTPAVSDDFEGQYYTHPSTGVQILGFKIPMWDDVLKMVHSCYDVLPYAKYVGWDIAISINGPLIIEANCGCPAIELLQKPFVPLGEGKRAVFSKYL